MSRITGALVNSYAIDVPADPGWSQPWRHKADAAGGDVERDDAPVGGGWQPYGWDTGVNVLAGESYSPPPSHKGTGHRGDYGRGGARERVPVGNRDKHTGGDGPAPLLGAGGAANGGLVATGVSAPWANAPVGRRRADGGTAMNPGGLRLGRRHVHTTEEHRQGLHFNRPSLRFIRMTKPTVSTEKSGRPVGAIAPKGRTILRPQGQELDVPAEPTNAGPIGGDWAL